uniref:Uncharacterized protein n=1 Tax=Romanomermis culicivorax TaxID=13658 RepID=A0A915K5Y2_ROMCU
MVMKPPPTKPMDAQQPQQPSTSTPQLDKHSQPIQIPDWYKHSIKPKTKQEEEAEYRKAHKACTIDELHARRTPPPSMSPTKPDKRPSK